MPYRTLDNFINGVVLTFTNITSLKALENKTNTLAGHSQALVKLLPFPALLLNYKQQVTTSNQAFASFFKIDNHDLEGIVFPVIAHEIWKTTKLDKMIKSLLQEKQSCCWSWIFRKSELNNCASPVSL